MSNRIGLDTVKAKALVKKLNTLLATYQIFYMNSRGFHWNIKGQNFFELHLKFEEIYNDLLLKVDEIAERILTLGGTPDHTFSEYLKTSKISEVTNVSNGKKAIKNILSALETVISLERKILSLASNADDEGTTALMSDYIREQEKLVWMFAAYLSE